MKFNNHVYILLYFMIVIFNILVTNINAAGKHTEEEKAKKKPTADEEQFCNDFGFYPPSYYDDEAPSTDPKQVGELSFKEWKEKSSASTTDTTPVGPSSYIDLSPPKSPKSKEIHQDDDDDEDSEEKKKKIKNDT